MQRNLEKLLYSLAALFTIAVLWSCEDDFDPGMGGIMDGTPVTVPVEINFDTETAIQLNSRALTDQSGTAIQDMDNFWMVIYNRDGSLRGKYQIRRNGVNQTPAGISNVSYSSNSDNRLPGESNLGDNAAGKLKFDLNLPSAEYFIYGVANVAGFDGKDISTRERLKNISCAWDSTNISNNREMFGIFSIGQHRDATDDAPIAVTVRDNRVQQLHCWMRRLASKVTVSFDGSELFDNVYVFIDTIMICDIPKQCTLGKPNHPGWPDDDPTQIADSRQRYNIDNGLIYWGGVDHVQKIDNLSLLIPEDYYHVCNGNHTVGGPTDIPGLSVDNDRHAHTSRSLYFYENMQGIGKDKRQSYDDKTIAFPSPKPDDLTSGWKDHKSYGTYVEVRGYYHQLTPYGEVSAGWIKYRFMLGQDTSTDYNALRNTHYKLTLKLRGNANDYDWHIDYREEPGIVTTSPQYISYLYNKSMYASVKVVGEMDNDFGLQAEIISTSESGFTDWGPWGNGTETFPSPVGHEVEGNPIFNSTGLVDNANGPWTSFLSLRKTTLLRLNPDDNMQSWQLGAKTALEYNKRHYTDEHKGNRTYMTLPQTAANDPTLSDDGIYTVAVNKWNKAEGASDSTATERIFRIPLYTRAKELVTKTGFTGNNPYISYPRKMTVRFTAMVRPAGSSEDFQKKHFDLEIIQVRRIVNPKGVWRKAGSSKPFHVTLMNIAEDGNDNFRSFKSVGRWSAEVITESDPIITLSSTVEGTGLNPDQLQSDVRRIEGDSECPVDFNINFKGAQSGYAIVRVRYNNFTCEHDIFCWVGMDPVEIVTGSGIRWRHSNVAYFDANNYAHYPVTPLQEGGMFRRASHIAILSSSNPVYHYQDETSSPTSALKVRYPSGTETTADWTTLIFKPDDTGKNPKSRFYTWSIANQNERIADCKDDFYSIASVGNNLNFPIKKAYGILYGEGSGGCITGLHQAVGYDNLNITDDGSNTDKGMLGVFVYNSTNCRTVFLPIGKAAHGRRKSRMASGWSANNDPEGFLRYASRSSYHAFGDQPLFSDIYRRPGALYWCRTFYDQPDDIHEKDANGNFIKINGQTVFKVNMSSSFDINFHSMGFEGFSNSAVDERNSAYSKTPQNSTTRIGYTSDAAFIRTVCY